MNRIFFLRLFVRVEAEAMADCVANEIVSLVCEHCEVNTQSIQKYWKIPEYYEIFFSLTIHHNVTKKYKMILDILASGWECVNELESVWNPLNGNKFCVANVMWAHFEAKEQ